MGAKVGERIGAIFGSNKDEVKFLGYGIRLEDEIPVKGVTMMGIDMNEIGRTNPTLLLDNGDKVYGCECWWGSEEQVKKTLDADDRPTVIVDMQKERDKIKEMTENENT